MQTPQPWWALVGVVLGFILSAGKDWFVRRWRRKAHWAALRAEIEYCCHLAKTYLQDDIAAPLYRLPTAAYAHAFSALLADGVPTEPETRTIIQFFTEAHTLNRGLDLAQAARERDDKPARQAEFARNRLKAERLVQDYGQAARAVVEAHR
jgi:hypothetical protein